MGAIGWSNRVVHAPDEGAEKTGARTEAGGLAPPEALLNAPGYAARRLYHAYAAAWVRHVDPSLTGPQFAVLTVVDCYPGREQGSLARAVALDRSTMGSIVARLVKRGFIFQETPADDGRKRLLHLTVVGRTTLQEAFQRARGLDELLMRGFEDEQADLVHRLNELSEHWESLVDD